MDRSDPFYYPATKATIHSYAASIFGPIQRDESVTTTWVPMSGRRKHNKFIIENIGLFEQELPGFNKYVLVYIEPLDLTEETIGGYLRLMAKSFIEQSEKHGINNPILKDKRILGIFDEQNVSYTKLLDALRNLLTQVTDNGTRIIFFVGEFDELSFANKIFYNNLKGLWAKLYPHIQYIFLMRHDVSREEGIPLWGDLSEVILQNVVNVPLLNEMDINYMFDRLDAEYGDQLPLAWRAVVTDLCGGHPYTLKVAHRFLMENARRDLSASKVEILLHSYYRLESITKSILDSCDEVERRYMKHIVSNQVLPDDVNVSVVNFLKGMNLITSKDNKWIVFSRLFEKVLKSENNKISDLVINEFLFQEETGEIVLSGKTVEENFTLQEYSVLKLLLQKAGTVCTRDDLGTVLWGEDQYEKYSDWAIDQLISKLRKKLEKVGATDKIITLRRKGYKLIKGSV